MVKGIINAFDHVKFCSKFGHKLLTMDGNWAVTLPPIIATGYSMLVLLLPKIFGGKHFLPT